MSPKPPTCQDCYFRRNGLCALNVEQICPTFRADGRTLEPPQQPQLLQRPLALSVPPAPAVAAAY
jgi:hypothetical protein